MISALILFTALLAQAQAPKNFIDQPYIEVNGQAVLDITPDKIFLRIEIREEDTKGRKSLEELESQMLTTLESLGLNIEKQVSVSDLSSNFKFYFLKRTDVFKNKFFSVETKSAYEAGQVVSSLAQEGISNIELESLEYSKEEELKLEVKVKAIQNAKQKAEMMLEALGQNLGGALHVQELGSPRMYNTLEERTAGLKIRGLAAMADASNVDFEKLKFEATVQVKFAIDLP